MKAALTMRFTVWMMAASLLCGCDGTVSPSREDARVDAVGRIDAAVVDVASLDAVTIDTALDAGGSEDVRCSLPPPVARPPSMLASRQSVVDAVAAEHPDWLANSCVSAGGTRAFLFEVVRRLRAEDPRWGLDRRTGALSDDIITYYFGDGCPEGSRDAFMVDVIARLCPRAGVDPPAGPSWIDRSGEGPVWTLMGYEAPSVGDAGVSDSGVARDVMTPMIPLPDGRPTVDAVARERPELLRNSCVDSGGNNEFLFEVVRRLRRVDPRWGLNWKRGNVGDMSQDVVDYFRGAAGAPMESSTDVYIVDVIGGHCGPTPSAAFTDVTEATAMGGTIGRWTLAGRMDL